MELPYILMGVHEARWGLKAKPHELEKVSQKRLRAVIGRAYRNVPFYSGKFRNRNIDPDQIKSLDDLSSLPVLTSRDVIDNWPEMIDQEVQDGGLCLQQNLGVNWPTNCFSS